MRSDWLFSCNDQVLLATVGVQGIIQSVFNLIVDILIDIHVLISIFIGSFQKGTL